jgi:hypothetical protein
LDKLQLVNKQAMDIVPIVPGGYLN